MYFLQKNNSSSSHFSNVYVSVLVKAFDCTWLIGIDAYTLRISSWIVLNNFKWFSEKTVSIPFIEKETKLVTKTTKVVVFAYTTKHTFETKTTKFVVFVPLILELQSNKNYKLCSFCFWYWLHIQDNTNKFKLLSHIKTKNQKQKLRR